MCRGLIPSFRELYYCDNRQNNIIRKISNFSEKMGISNDNERLYFINDIITRNFYKVLQETCLIDAKMDKRSVDEVILVGGSTRIPKVQSMLQEFFDGKQLCQSINPDEAVAYGAAIMAAKLSGDGTTKLLKDLILKDVTPLSIGTKIDGDIMSVVIPQNTLIPTKKTATFVTAEDNQSSIMTEVYQGERTIATGNHLLGEFTIFGIPLAPKGVTKVEETYSYLFVQF